MNDLTQQLLADQYYNDTSAGLAVGAIIGIVFGVLVFAAMLYVYSRVIVKAGYSWAWVFVVFVPILNIVMFFIFAFQEWPIQRELKMARGEYPGGQYGGQYPQGGQYGGQYPQGGQYGGQYPQGGQHPGQVPPSQPDQPYNG